ncbi:3'(2'),5'-bisphosphate nucleotidase CysQ [Hyphobacterium sp. SN044]|uniref:3'(2'),5'-bisphosphate nucleotidase CysQ n=1 Tax=Hyphobacterium sp. SN044 TaxID=2912575 RepID=UPI001F019543|nr:3'(2'),5'-bisphosphate nucleotidase CysQ [Hyphobacterium sp. SN044]MCF8879899.1 3'(2'),5'-bisphosphate nucleotidase CysQ [Hyphobacterium sp. SN044]
MPLRRAAEPDQIALALAQIAARAGVAVMNVYDSDFEARNKSDKSPVTDADERAEAVILEALESIFPGIPVLAEEQFEAGIRPDTEDHFFLVDPVDGTREFVNRNGEFTVNIALIHHRRPIAGCVFAPALKRLYCGGASAYAGPVAAGDDVREDLLVPVSGRDLTGTNLVAVMSRSHLDEETKAWADQAGVTDAVSAGSSLKFCLLAEGKADVYPRFGPTMEWDTAAGHAVLQAAGGHVIQPDGTDFLYGKTEAGYRNGPFIAKARR